MSLIDLGPHLETDDCLWCIGGMSPAGIHPDLGPVLRLCPTRQWCEECGDTALFPAEYETLDDRINELFDDGYVAFWCEHCIGVIAVVPATNDGGIR